MSKQNSIELMKDIIRLAGEMDQNTPLLVEVNNPIILKELALDLYKRLEVAIKALESVKLTSIGHTYYTADTALRDIRREQK